MKAHLHGHESWELDALSPKVISALISKHILENMEQDLYDTQAKRQADARAELKEISSEYENVLMEHREFPKIQQMLEVDAGTSPAHVAAAVDDLRAQKSLACESLRIVTTENETLKKRVAEETQKNIEYINKAGKEIARLEKELRTAQKVKK